MSLNRATILGNLGKDPEVRYTPEGTAIANVSVATTEKWKDKSGEQKEKTEWHRVSFFGKTAEAVGEYLKKGSRVYVEGKLSTRKWTDKAGVDHYTTEINATKMEMLDKKEGGDSGKSHDSESKAPQKTGTSFDDMDDDIPF